MERAARGTVDGRLDPGVDRDELTMRMFPDGVVEITAPCERPHRAARGGGGRVKHRRRELLGT